MKEQYELVKESRATLFAYCKTIANHDLLKENSSFGRGSIRNLLVHIANIYEYWIGTQGLKEAIKFSQYDSNVTMSDIACLFDAIDLLTVKFIDHIEKENINKISYERNGLTKKIRPLVLFTHVITHEFHHKGQILSLSRHLGYVPVDTDIIR